MALSRCSLLPSAPSVWRPNPSHLLQRTTVIAAAAAASFSPRLSSNAAAAGASAILGLLSKRCRTVHHQSAYIEHACVCVLLELGRQLFEVNALTTNQVPLSGASLLLSHPLELPSQPTFGPFECSTSLTHSHPRFPRRREKEKGASAARRRRRKNEGRRIGLENCAARRRKRSSQTQHILVFKQSSS